MYKTSLKIQPVQQDLDEMAKVQNPKFFPIGPKLRITDNKSILKCYLCEDYFKIEFLSIRFSP